MILLKRNASKFLLAFLFKVKFLFLLSITYLYDQIEEHSFYFLLSNPSV